LQLASPNRCKKNATRIDLVPLLRFRDLGLALFM
jgi:hypothetical protein